MRLFLFMAAFLLSLSVYAQMQAPEGVPPHASMETGVIEGTLYKLGEKGAKNPFPDQTVVIMVFQNGQRVLMLDKETDKKGKFSFKNIFADPSFAYAVGSMIGSEVYVLPDLQLKPGQGKITVDFPIGPGSPHLVQTMSGGAPPGDPSMMSAASDGDKTPYSTQSMGHPYQKVTIALTIFVLFLAVRTYRARKVS